MRAELEGLAAELAATRIADRQLEELRAARALFRRAIDAIVNRTWAALSGSSRLLEQNVEEHRRVLEAIEARDPAQARARMVAHVRHAGELIARGLEERERRRETA